MKHEIEIRLGLVLEAWKLIGVGTCVATNEPIGSNGKQEANGAWETGDKELIRSNLSHVEALAKNIFYFMRSLAVEDFSRTS